MDLIRDLLQRENRREKMTKAFTWTHGAIPEEDDREKLRWMLDTRTPFLRELRTFLKTVNIKTNTSCYETESSERCSVLDGVWRPGPMPEDLYKLIKFPNEVGWMISSAKNTGSQLHIDPNLMGAWNLLLTGRKWWVVIPSREQASHFSCDAACSHPMWKEQQGNAWPWFEHVLPQIQDRRFFGKPVFQFIQKPGEVLYLPHGYPHTVHNLEDNMALTNNALFPDALSSLVNVLALKKISSSEEMSGWSEEVAIHNLYNTQPRDTRERIRENVERVKRLV